MNSNQIAYTGFVAFVSIVLTLVVVNLVQSSTDSQPADNGAATDGETVYRLDQVAEHNNASSCWKVIEGVVYDLTEYLPNHPAEEETFTRWCGKEATSVWQDKGNGRPHSPRAAAHLESYRIGVIEGGESESASVEPESVSARATADAVDTRSGQMMLALAPGNCREVFDFHEQIINLYKTLIGKAEIPEARELLESLLTMEQNESMRLARQIGRMDDL